MEIISNSNKHKIKEYSRWAAEELIKREQFRGEIYDAYCHDDGILEAFHNNGNAVFRTSLDFLEYNHGATNVVTEPRPDLGVAYTRKALSIVTSKVALLLPISFMVRHEAKELFKKTPLARIYVITKPMRFRSGRMAWYIFEKGHFEGPSIRWI